MSSTDFPRVTAYTITYNQRSLVEQTVLDLFGQEYPPDRYEIVVLDDGSSDGTTDLLQSLANASPVPMRVLTIRHEADYLSARRWNQCIQEASAATEVFVQMDDVRLRSGFLKAHVRWHVQAGDYLVTGAKFEADTETWELAACRRHMLAGLGGTAAECNYLAAWGASLSFTRRLMEKVWQEPYDRPYDERMTGWGFQEVEFAYRMQRAGARVIYDPQVGVFHRYHQPAVERLRGLEREALVRAGSKQNEQYMCLKHNLEDLPWW